MSPAKFLVEDLAGEFTGTAHKIMGLESKGRRKMNTGWTRVLMAGPDISEEDSVDLSDAIEAALRGPGG